MKTLIIKVIALCSLIIHTIQLSCPAGFVGFTEVPYSGQNYCVKCDSTCLTCSGPNINNCVTCPIDFSYDSTSKYCYPPMNDTVFTLQSSYKFYGFNKMNSWLPAGLSTTNCISLTVLKSSTTQIYTYHTLKYHYQFRVRVALVWLQDYNNIVLSVNTSNNGAGQLPKNFIAPTSGVTNTTSNTTGLGIKMYCDNSRIYNYEHYVTNTGDQILQIKFSSTTTVGKWGIRQYVFIEYRCNITWCSKCTGVAWNSCTQCADTHRDLFNGTGQCRCDSVQHYYKHPDDDYCVSPCPSRPADGQYYGDPQTKSCALLCPTQATNTNWGVLYADDISAQCITTCPNTITLGLVSKPLFHDVQNRKCVTQCPSTKPYSWWVNRTCYSICPSGYYKYDLNMSCVSQCPTNTAIPLYAHNDTTDGKCVQQCVGVDYWADPLTHKCTATCSGGVDWFEDSSSGRNVCIQICPYPQYFGDHSTGKCVLTCPPGKYGDMHSSGSRHCVTLCNGSYFGLRTGNRTCVQTCPLNTWGQRATYTCILAPTSCDGTRYADSHIKLCVDGGTCSLGMFSRNDTRTCQMECPGSSYADDRTKYCEAGCLTPLFADPGINYCVATCFTQDLYADIDSSRTCVASCNQAGNYPFRDPYTKTCVNNCPHSPNLFADPIVQSCVYNCTVNTYADSSTSNHTCVANCPDWRGSGGQIYFADNSTGYGICVVICPADPPLFGDIVSGYRVCVQVCSPNSFGDQDPTGKRHCVPTCPSGYFAQDDDLRRCVIRCNSTTYGYSLVCYPEQQCPPLYVGDPSTNLCVLTCPVSQGTFSDFISKLCVQKCPIAPNATKFYADLNQRYCRSGCTLNRFGNNDTLTCELKCLDTDSYADAQHPNRYCIDLCTHTATDFYYRNNYTQTCVLSTGCQYDYFADNSTWKCVASCPIVAANQTWGHIDTQTCVQQCHPDNGGIDLFGDASTGVALCIQVCPIIPPKWAYDGNHTCMQVCPTSPALYGQDFTRTCVATCPNVTLSDQTFKYQPTRRCLKQCPQTYFADYLQGVCWPTPQQCTFGWGDDFNNSCTYKCTGPTPWDSFGDNATSLCTILCTAGSYADNYTGTRICVAVCPGTYDIQGTPTLGSHDSFGDSNTWHCVSHCLTPNRWADWQTHKCESRCSGDISSDVPTYAQLDNYRCVIAKACPLLPDKLFGDNNTRTCLTRCINDGIKLQWACNITRTCLPQCMNTTNTRFFGDLTTNSPICVITCAKAPRQFGQNSTNKCVDQCPDHQYGDQTGNRSCVALCPVIGITVWFSQITQRICVKVCQDTTYGNYHNSHCQTTATDCIPGQFGDNSTHLCVPTCPQIMNYFGDPSTKLCVDRCPNITAQTTNTTAFLDQDPQQLTTTGPFYIDMPPGILYADYQSRRCRYRCPSNHSLHGTFGDNFTNTCVQRCPDGSWGDPNLYYRHCVAVCSVNSFADNLTNRCVSTCPASPPYFGQTTGWTCVKICSASQWADSSTRRCVPTCPNSGFRVTLDTRRQCVDVCPSQPDLYGDLDTGNCQSVCTAGKYADPIDRMCKTSCLNDHGLYQYNQRCVHLCPDGYYADNLGNCVVPTSCQASTYGDNRTTLCVSTCTGGSFADPNSRYCIAICPNGWWGDVNVCVQSCNSAGFSLSNITNQCQSSCPKLTYHQNGFCVTNCAIEYNNDVTGSCSASCPSLLYADPVSHDCLQTCVNGYYRDLNTGFCTNDCSPQFKDFITNNCVDKCSPGYWGYTGNYSCLDQCVSGQYGYQSTTQRTCYTPANLPLSAPQLFADSISGQFIAVCQTVTNQNTSTTDQYYGDRNRNQCVKDCLAFGGTQYYGDPQSRQCQSTCTNTTFYTADPIADQCVLRCTLGTFRFNATPICQNPCSTGYADPSTRICVDICPQWADTFGFYNVSNQDRICIEKCPANYYAYSLDRTCRNACPFPYFALDQTNQCVIQCINSFADQSNRRCVSQCLLTYPWADNSTNQCVTTCPSTPDYYGQNHVCVYYCQTAGYFADPISRQCKSRCPTPAVGVYTYGDVVTGRCVTKCPLGFYGDNSTNLCVTANNCPSSSFADNQTRVCVIRCPQDQNIYGDPLLHVCAYQCSGGRFGSQITQQCVVTCQLNYWGDPLTTLCTSQCPAKIYSYGQNITRKCVSSCVGTGGFADNHTRLCRDKCQNSTTPQTFADTTTTFCVQICPQLYFAENQTQTCVQTCFIGDLGYADNYSRFCVAQCPDDPQTYADLILRTCVYTCARGQFSRNDTNQCVIKCPSVPDFYGDPHIGRCVYFCTQGSYAQNDSRQCQPSCPTGQYADNLTRRCVSLCPSTEGTFGDSITNRCVRICPDGWYARNDTQTCVLICPKYGNGTQSYADNITKYCVAQCPYPLFGQNTSHSCVQTCPSASNQYGHFQGRVCVLISDCYQVSNTKYFANSENQTCVQKCSQNLWADDHLRRCVSTCQASIPQYRNMHDQTCVPLCPIDPDQYADATTGNCVRVCPPGYFAHSYPGFRQCITDCGFYGLFQDNSTNRCVAVCPTQPYMYADPTNSKCVFYCRLNYFADNKSQACVPQCPAAWEYYGDVTTYRCESLCPPGYWADTLANRECTNGYCSSGYFRDDNRSKCVLHCSQIKQYYYEEVNTMSCVDVCPGLAVGYNIDQVCLYPSAGGVYPCPGLFFADTVLKQCVLLCPNGTYATNSTKKCQDKCFGSQYADDPTTACVTTCSNNLFAYNDAVNGNKCLQFCPTPYFAQNSTRKCVLGCSSLLALNTTNSCQSYCPQPFFADFANKVCVLNCTPKYSDSITRQCITPCILPNYNDVLTKQCTLLCPQSYFGRNDTRDCSLQCYPTSFADPSTRICVTQCPNYPLMFADDRNNSCVYSCLTPRFQFLQNRTCLISCPNSTVGGNNIIYLADSFLRACVLFCKSESTTYADYQNNLCTNFCPTGTYASNYTKQCVPICPNIPNDTFAQNNSHMCVARCPLNTYGQSRILHCVSNCWWPNYADDTTNLCVDFCPDGYFAQNSTAKCLQFCPPNQYADPTTHRCVTQCPAIQDLFKHDIGWVCVANCPNGYYADQNTRKCQAICDSTTGLYAYSLTNQCLRECPYPYRGYDVNHTCVLDCPDPYFYNKSRSICTRCQTNCLKCTSPTGCTICSPGFNLFNGMCNTNCIPTATLITYAHPTTGNCIQVCPGGYYGDNSTYACKMTCPIKQYGSIQTKLCQHCPATCSACTSLTFCSLCQGNATMAIDNMCYTDCNSTHKYYYNNSCYSACPTKTFLSYTNVNCIACSSICGTCAINATTCTSCDVRYYYNSTCLAQCPIGYYGSGTKVCLPCSGSNASACNKPLTFNTTIYIQNFTYVINMTYNQNVTFTKSLLQILKVNLQLQRRLLQIQNYINNGVPFTFQILSDGTIKIKLQITDNLINPVFVVQILDPTAVISTANGGTLQNTQGTVQVAQVQYYQPSTSFQAKTNMAAKFVVIFILVLYAASFIFSDTMVRLIQFLQILALHTVILVQIPANMYYYFYNLKPALLEFLPNWLAIPLPDQIIHLNTPLKIVDMFFDYNFVRNVGQFVFLFVILVPLFIIFGLLSNKRLVQDKRWLGLWQAISKNRYRLMIINDVLSVFYIPIMWFAFMQFQDLIFEGYLGFCSFLSIFMILVAIIIPTLWFIIWFRNTPQQLNQNYWFMTHRLKQQPSRCHLDIFINYVYLLLVTAFMTAFYFHPQAQLYLLIILHLVYILYLLIIRPYSNILNLILPIFICLAMMTAQSFFLFFYYNSSLTSTEKYNIAYPMLIAISVVLVGMLAWALWRFVWQIMYLLNSFKQTEFYKVYADPQHEVSQIMSQKYEKIEKAAETIQQKPGDVFIQKVYKQVAENGQNIIKIRKKVLKKKKKPIRRAAQDDQDQQFIRINKVNPFDYQNKEQQIKMIEKRHIDDDVRDQLSQGQNNKTEQQKVISVQQNQRMIFNSSQMGDQEYINRNRINQEEQQMEEQHKTQHLDLYSEQKSQSPKKPVHNMYKISPEDLLIHQSKSSHDSQQINQNFINNQSIEKVQDIKKPDDQLYQQQIAIQKEKQYTKKNNQVEIEKGIQRNKQFDKQARKSKALFDFDLLQQELSQDQQKNKEKIIEQKKNQQKPRTKNIEQLLQEQDKNKKKLLFLFDQLEDLDEQN